MKRTYSPVSTQRLTWANLAGHSVALGALALLPLAAGAQAPVITGVSPVPGTRNAPRTSPVQVSFSQPLAGNSAAALQVYSAQRGGRRTRGTTPAVVSGSQLTYTPPAAQPWLPGETVFATVTQAAASSGGALAQSKVFQFTAATAPATGAFALGSTVSQPAYTSAVAVGDVDGDGDLDLVTADSQDRINTPGSASVRLNGGDASGSNTGTFGSSSAVAVDNQPTDVVLGDVDGDGDLDLVTANINNGSGGGSVNVRLNGGDASGSNTGTFSNGSTIVGAAGNIILGDVDGDGDLDLVTSGGAIRLNGGDASGSNTGTFSNGSVVAGGGRFGQVALGDVDGDDDLDIVLISGNNTVMVYLNGGSATGSNTGLFSLGSSVSVGLNPLCVALGDVDGDGDLDLVTGNQDVISTGSASVRLNGGDASGSNTGTFSNGSTTTIIGYLSNIALGDIDGDGDLDLLASGGDLRGGVSVHRNGGDASGSNTGIFTSAGAGSAPGGPRTTKIALGDVNGDGTLDLLVGNYFSSGSVYVSFGTPATPTITSFSAYRGPVGTSLLITGSRFNTTTSVAFNGTPAPGFVIVSATQLLVSVPAGATTGPVTVTNAQATATSAVPFTVTNAPTTTWTGAGGSDWYAAASWTAGVPTATLDALVPVVSTAYPVLNSSTATAGSLTIAPGATLTQIGGTLSLTGDLTNNGTFAATGGTVATSGSALQYLGGTSPLALQNLTIGASGATLSGAVSFRRVLTLVGDLATNGQVLTLRSSVSGGVTTDGLVVNQGGVVVGAATVQRAIDPSLNPGLGYRHFSAPVSGSTVADLATTATGGSFTPVVNTTYNTPTSLAALPFPTVFGYSDWNLGRTANLPAFDKGFFSPTALSDALTVGQGYAVNIRANEVVDFQGSLNNGNKSLSLLSARQAYPEGGWQLLGNPYPAPLDYSRVDPADRPNLEAAIYVYQSTGQYTGRYRSYVNGVGNPVLPVGQGFFVRATAAASGTFFFRFRNSQRLTEPNGTAFQRPAADPRPQVQLELSGAGLTDTWTTYAETGATPAFDTAFDAAKLPNPTGLNLSSLATASGESLAIDGRPAFTAATALPLAVGVPAAGSYSITAADVANLPAGLDAYLADAQTGLLTKLSPGASYSFGVSAAEAQNLLTGRFTLLFRPATALATVPTLSADVVGVYPNPAHERFTVTLPGLTQATTVQAELLNSLGQVVRRQAAALPATGTQLTLEAAGLATGVYTLRLQAGATTLAKRLVVQ